MGKPDFVHLCLQPFCRSLAQEQLLKILFKAAGRHRPHRPHCPRSRCPSSFVIVIIMSISELCVFSQIEPNTLLNTMIPCTLDVFFKVSSSFFF